MKKTVRSVLAFAMALAIMVTTLGGTAFAASSAATTIEGYSATANVSYMRTGATATTKYGGPSTAYVSAIVTAYYESGDYDYYKSKSGQQTPGYSVATITIDIGGAQVRGAMGTHQVFYNNVNWTPSTSAGTILQGALPG